MELKKLRKNIFGVPEVKQIMRNIFFLPEMGFSVPRIVNLNYNLKITNSQI